MNRVTCAALLFALLAFSALGQTVNWSAGVVYGYDGSGNVTSIGADTYVYDTAHRLIRGSVAGSQQSYGYDSFGNRVACQPAGGGDCQYGFTVNSSTNRIANRAYDKRGNMLQLPEGNTLEYDELGMVRKENGNGRQVYYLYTADDERIVVYDADTQLAAHTWRWTVRGLDKKPLREFTSSSPAGTANFQWSKDHIWRDGALLASRQPDPAVPGGVSTYHYHVDHLGTPRRVTNTSGVIVGRHDYLPFGPEASASLSEPQAQRVKFTGHERDVARDRPPLDYMHARYYEARLGRFLSTDPAWESADLAKPQSWNRYSYVLNNPVNAVDPDGRLGFLTNDPARLRKRNDKIIGYAAKAIAVVVLDAESTGAAADQVPRPVNLEQRAKDLHGALLPDTQRRTTTAVAEVTNPDGTRQTIVASSEKRLRPAQIAALRAGEIAVEGAGHAEQTIINAATASGQKVEGVAASRPICPACAAAIKKIGAEAASVFKRALTLVF
jgi:RHS repeat-associated protein